MLSVIVLIILNQTQARTYCFPLGSTASLVFWSVLRFRPMVEVEILGPLRFYVNLHDYLKAFSSIDGIIRPSKGEESSRHGFVFA